MFFFYDKASIHFIAPEDYQQIKDTAVQIHSE